MSWTNQMAADILELVLNNQNIANIGDATGLQGSTVDGNLYISLHTADPGETGDQTTNECAYTSYARDDTYWTVTVADPASASPNADIDFPEATGGSETATHWGIGTDSSGAGTLLASGSIAPTISISSGASPKLTTASTFTLD